MGEVRTIRRKPWSASSGRILRDCTPGRCARQFTPRVRRVRFGQEADSESVPTYCTSSRYSPILAAMRVGDPDVRVVVPKVAKFLVG